MSLLHNELDPDRFLESSILLLTCSTQAWLVRLLTISFTYSRISGAFQSPISVLVAYPNLQASMNLCHARGLCLSRGDGWYASMTPRIEAMIAPLPGGGEDIRV